MGHQSMGMTIDMAKGVVTGVVLKELPDTIQKLDSCQSCMLMKAQNMLLKEGHKRATEPLEHIHRDLVEPMPMEWVSKEYRFILMDNYSRASRVLP